MKQLLALLLVVSTFLISCSPSTGGGGGGGTPTGTLTMSNSNPDSQRNGDMVITSALRTDAGGGSVVVTLEGTINGEYAKVLIYFTGGVAANQHPSAIIYDRGGSSLAAEYSNSCSSGGIDCSASLVNPTAFSITFTNQQLDNTVDGSSVTLTGTILYSVPF